MDDTYLDEIVWGVNSKWWPEERNKREARYLDSLIKLAVSNNSAKPRGL